MTLTSIANELSTDLPTITAEINAYQRIAGEAIFEIGRRLKHVKENDLAHGEWSKWCAESIGMTRQHAHRFIKVYEELGQSNVTSGLQIGVKALYEIATMPAEERTKPHIVKSTGETKTVDEMTVRELREVKKALKEAEERCRQLESEVNKPPKVEYVKVESTPDDYVRMVDDSKREDFYREFADDLEYIQAKYGSLVFDALKLQVFAEMDGTYADKVNKFGDFWNQYMKSVNLNPQIIEAEVLLNG